MDSENPLTHFKPPVSEAQVEHNREIIESGDIDLADIAGLSGLCGAPNHLEFPESVGFDPEAHSGVLTFKLMDMTFFDKNEVPMKWDELYCKFTCGGHSEKADCRRKQESKLGCSETVMLNRTHDEQYAELRIKDTQRQVATDIIGMAKINLDEPEQKGRILKWYPLKREEKTVGEVLVEISYRKYERD